MRIDHPIKRGLLSRSVISLVQVCCSMGCKWCMAYAYILVCYVIPRASPPELHKHPRMYTYTCNINAQFKSPCSNQPTTEHGNLRGTTTSDVDLSNHNLVGVAVRAGVYVDQITFIGTHLLHETFKIFGPYGGTGGKSPGFMFGVLQTFYGREGDGIDQIGLKGTKFGC